VKDMKGKELGDKVGFGGKYGLSHSETQTLDLREVRGTVRATYRHKSSADLHRGPCPQDFWCTYSAAE
jgi:hypothetical protein